MLVPIGRFIVTKDIVDRDSERIIPSGANLENFKKNPIMFYNHMRWDGGIGTWDNIEVTDSEIAMDGYVSDSTEYSKEKLGLVQDGVIRTASMGFRPKKWSDDSKDKLEGQLGVTILEYEVIEVSITDVPANPDAVMKSMDKKDYKVYSDFKSWQEDKEGVIVKSFHIKNFNNMNILSIVNKFLGTSFGEDAKPEDVEAAFKKMSETKGMSQEAVEKSMKDFSDVTKSFVKSEIEEATKSLNEEIELLKSQMKEMKGDNSSPDGDEDESLDDAKVEKSDNIIDVTKFFTPKSNANA
jgi:HK97 family phage prohead protease